MKLSRFNDIVDAYGAEPDGWPERERADALAMSRSSVAAARALAQARKLDIALRNGALHHDEAHSARYAQLHPAHFAQLHARIMAGVNTIPKSWFGRNLGVDLAPTQLWPSLAGLAIATVLGIAVGLSGWLQLDVNGDLDDQILSSIDLPAVGQ